MTVHTELSSCPSYSSSPFYFYCTNILWAKGGVRPIPSDVVQVLSLARADRSLIAMTSDSVLDPGVKTTCLESECRL